MPERKKALLVTGKRKTAVAKAILKPGSGRVMINSFPLNVIKPEMAQMKIMEPLIIAGDKTREVDITVNVTGGGIMAQADAARMAIAKGLAEWTRSSELRKKLIAYDRTMLAGDQRRTEPKKFGGPGPRRRKQKSYR
ncbi:TPA: 30S ribosomal protein S9 [Candidatus Bathyarchaeota archaeon]|nr:30S ribosomal protein S9 [Candidatus Bathyarchaeota archaeon]